MEITIKKWGNSLGFRIPAAWARQMDIHEGTKLEILEEDGKLLIIPPTKENQLNALLEKISPENQHGETDFGEPEGGEAW